MTVVEAMKVSKQYGPLTAIDQLSLHIDEHKLIGLVGRNGAGKSTLLKLIAGFIKPSAGTIKVFGSAPFNNLMVSAQSILIYDRLPLVPSLTIEEYLEIMGQFYANWDHELARKLCHYFELNFKADPARLSKGQQNTFYTILGIATRSPLTLLDEPTLGMDKAVRTDIYRLILKDYLHHPRTLIISSHLIGEMADLLEEIILIDRGKLLVHQPVDELSQAVIRLQGSQAILDPLLNRFEVFEQHELGKGTVSLVIKNELSQSMINHLKSKQVKISPLALDEVCVYLTKNSRGGIDDVFKDNWPVQ